MLPVRAVDYGIDSAAGDIEAPRQLGAGYAIGPGRSNLANANIRQLRAARAFTMRRSPRTAHLGEVLALSAEAEVIGTEAVRRVATVQDDSFPQRRERDLQCNRVGKSVYQDRPNRTAEVDLPVAVSSQAIPLPKPAFRVQITDSPLVQTIKQSCVRLLHGRALHHV